MGRCTSELIRTRFGFHIIRVDGRRPLKPVGDTVRPKLDTGSPTRPGPAPSEEEVRVRHIFVITQDADTFERRFG
jgi:parvulin-like peptidyl-prolyl isomerase